MILEGVLYSKANSRRIIRNRRTGKSMVIKSPEALDAVKSFSMQARALWRGEPLPGPVRLTVDVYYPSRRQDLDVSLLMDILQGICYHNDRQIEEMVLRKGLDREWPRVVVEVVPRETKKED